MIAAFLLALSVYPIQSTNHLCPICVATKKLKSTVYSQGCSKTMTNCGDAYWDLSGNIVFPQPCNKTHCEYRCSQGHQWAEEGNTL